MRHSNNSVHITDGHTGTFSTSPWLGQARKLLPEAGGAAVSEPLLHTSGQRSLTTGTGWSNHAVLLPVEPTPRSTVGILHVFARSSRQGPGGTRSGTSQTGKFPCHFEPTEPLDNGAWHGRHRRDLWIQAVVQSCNKKLGYAAEEFEDGFPPQAACYAGKRERAPSSNRAASRSAAS